MLGRPNLYTSYHQETQLLPTWTQKTAFAVLAAVLVLMPFELPVLSSVPVVRFLGDDEWLRPMSHVLVFAIAALGSTSSAVWPVRYHWDMPSSWASGRAPLCTWVAAAVHPCGGIPCRSGFGCPAPV